MPVVPRLIYGEKKSQKSVRPIYEGFVTSFKIFHRSLNGKRIRVSIAKPRMKGYGAPPPAGAGRNRRCYHCLETGHLARDCYRSRRSFR